MARQSIPAETRRALKQAQDMIHELFKEDGNEAETRRRVERIFERVLGYDTLKHLTRERAVKGAGETEHVDFAVHIKRDAPPVILVELKRVSIDLATKHLKQVVSYAIDAGCEWVLLTNGREWKIYHIEFGQPPKTTLLEQWNLLADELPVLAARFDLISHRSLKRGVLAERWRQTKVLEPSSLLAAMLGPDALNLVRRRLRQSTGVQVQHESIIEGVRRLLNETAATELDALSLKLPVRKRRAGKVGANRASAETSPTEPEPAPRPASPDPHGTPTD